MVLIIEMGDKAHVRRLGGNGMKRRLFWPGNRRGNRLLVCLVHLSS